MKKILYAIGITAIAFGLVGCGDRKVTYNDELTVATVTDTEIIRESGKLTDKLGITETSWKETIETADGSIDIKVKIVVPDVENMHTVLASKKYLTNDDKKRIMECIVDADSIVQDCGMILTKEDIDENISMYYAQLEEEIDEKYKEKIQKQIEYYESLREGALNEADLISEVGDYSGNFYIGSKDGMAYRFKFYNDSNRNRSAFSISRITNKDDMYFEALTENNKNTCKYTEEEAKQIALEYCEKLGLPNMKVINIQTVEKQNGLDTEDKIYSCYDVGLVRDIEGVGNVAHFIYLEDSDQPYSYENPQYSREVVRVRIDDEGMLSINATGLLTEGETQGPVHLLGIEQIKETVRQNVSHQADGWYSLELKYLRIKDLDDEDKFCFIPVWVYMYDGLVGNELDYLGINALYINAIDGKVVDVVKEGAINMQDSKICLEYEYY